MCVDEEKLHCLWRMEQLLNNAAKLTRSTSQCSPNPDIPRIERTVNTCCITYEHWISVDMYLVMH
jgi:hypothetical protein